MRQIDALHADAVAGRIEDVPVALLDCDRELLLRPCFQLVHLGLLVLGEVGKALGLLQLPQGQTKVGLAAHLVLAGIIGNREHQIVAQRPQS